MGRDFIGGNFPRGRRFSQGAIFLGENFWGVIFTGGSFHRGEFYRGQFSGGQFSEAGGAILLIPNQSCVFYSHLI